MNSFYVTLPSGSFSLVVQLNTLARVKGSSREGLLTCFSFDPAQRKQLELQMPELIGAAQSRSLLDGAQLQLLKKRETELSKSYSRFSHSWQRFAQVPAAPAARNAFFATMIDLQQVITILDRIDARAFFIRDQRIKLRSMGHVIKGDYMYDYQRDMITLEHYPLSQLVSDWNSRRIWSHGPVERISVRKGREHDEADLTVKLRLPVHDPVNGKLLMEAILRVDGIQ